MTCSEQSFTVVLGRIGQGVCRRNVGGGIIGRGFGERRIVRRGNISRGILCFDGPLGANGDDERVGLVRLKVVRRDDVGSLVRS